ncbi:MAG: phage holin family protein [Paludibacterium sp.]|uniref:phage holin family protein n=1 Tax=Paludibacterium sp. TaxID=1917523 RepID=UPI0025DAA3BE|nr:phage holin family protein [Paludibacterium sp.]MBV8046295.1 phage holin family protein [Paludibacterium sp.]MBV8647706.1 phage holin family protein [Paludibacterium sp.]
MRYLDLLNDVLCLAGCLRLIFFTRRGAAHHPWASMLAYLLIIAFGAAAILPWLEHSPGYGLAQMLLNAVLVAALFAVDGDVTKLFRPRCDTHVSLLQRVLKRRTWL